MPENLYISDNFSVSRPIYINRYARESGKPRRAELPMTGAALCGGAFGVCVTPLTAGLPSNSLSTRPQVKGAVVPSLYEQRESCGYC